MIKSITSFFQDVIDGDTHTILIVATVYFAMMGFISLALLLRIRSWPMVPGRLVHSSLNPMSPSMRADEVNYSVYLKYNYVVDGVKYEGKRLSPTYIVASANIRFLLTWQMSGITKVENEEVAVYYKPSNPIKSYLIKPGKITLICLIAIIMLPLIFWYPPFRG